MNFKTQANFKPGKGESYLGVKSITVPDQNIPIKVLLQKHTRGLYTGVKEYNHAYIDDSDAMNADVFEVIEKRRELDKRADELKAVVNKEVETAKKPVEETGPKEENTVLDNLAK